MDQTDIKIMNILQQDCKTTTREIGKMVQGINGDGVTVLLVEQSTRMAANVADTCYVLETGSIAACGLTQELLKSDVVRKVYLGL